MGLNKFTRLFLLIVICLAAVIVGNYMIRSHPKRKESTQAKTIYLVETGQPRTSAQFEGNLAQFEGAGIDVTQLEASSEITYKLDTRNAIPEKQLSTVSTTSPRAIHFNLLTESNTVELLLPDRSLGIAERVNLPESGSDIYISVRSTARNHETRLALNLATWMQTVDPLQVFRFVLPQFETLLLGVDWVMVICTSTATCQWVIAVIQDFQIMNKILHVYRPDGLIPRPSPQLLSLAVRKVG